MALIKDKPQVVATPFVPPPPGGQDDQVNTLGDQSSTTRTSSSGASSNDGTAAKHLGTIGKYNSDTVKEQYARAIRGFDQSDAANRALADTQIKQHQKTAAGDRFAQAKKLQTAATTVIGSAGNALQGSGLGSLIDMIRTRTDLDTNEVFSALKQNKNAVWNALQEALNANVNARNDAANQAETAIRDIEADTAAQMNNINPSLFKTPGLGGISFGSKNFAKDRFAQASKPQTSGYYFPDAINPQRNVSRVVDAQGNSSYFDDLINSYNQGRRTWG